MNERVPDHNTGDKNQRLGSLARDKPFRRHLKRHEVYHGGISSKLRLTLTLAEIDVSMNLLDEALKVGAISQIEYLASKEHLSSLRR